MPSTSSNTITAADRELLRAASLAAIVNAADLLADAQLLQEHGRHARAVSLSIIGNEELAKALLYVLAALDAVSGLRDRLPSRNGPAKNHTVKQVGIEFAGIGAWLVDECYSILHDEAGGWGAPDRVGWLCDFLRHDEEWAQEEVTWLEQKEAGQLTRGEAKMGPSQRYQAGIKQMLSEGAMGRWGLPHRTPEEKKWDGLYVDVEGVVSTPASIGSRAAELAIVELEANIATVAEMRRALEDEDLLAGTLRTVSE